MCTYFSEKDVKFHAITSKSDNLKCCVMLSSVITSAFSVTAL